MPQPHKPHKQSILTEEGRPYNDEKYILLSLKEGIVILTTTCKQT